MALLPLIRRNYVIRKLRKCRALSPETAVTFQQAGIINPNGFQRVTRVMLKRGTLAAVGDRYYLLRACLKIEEMPDFWSKGGDFKEKTASNTCVLRGFSTQKATALGQKDGVFDFSNEP